jgi:SAM-dependent methyltransferase
MSGWAIVRRVNGAELYLLSRKLMAIATEAMPGDTIVRRLKPGARVVLEDVVRNMGTTADEIAARTGLQAGQVEALVSELAGEDLLELDGERIRVSRNRPFGANPFAVTNANPIDEGLAAALGAGEDEAQRIAAELEDLARRLGTGTILRTTADFDMAYRGKPPWDTGRPQPAFAELAEAGALRGRVLDVGCGTGEHALLAAALGLPATGVDAAPAAIEIARRKAAERSLTARFLVHDALDLGTLGGQFDTVLDSALFHVFTDEQRPRYAESLRRVIPPGGRYFMTCFSDRQPGTLGPRRVSQSEIEATFGEGWQIDAIVAVTMEVVDFPAGARAWRASLTRI